MRVGDLVEELDGNQPNVSKHLQILYQAGIVGRRREGKSIVYSLNDPTVFRLCELVHRNEAKKRAGCAKIGFAGVNPVSKE
jgi:DNA-binding transcriptional ArsR family regulator